MKNLLAASAFILLGATGAIASPAYEGKWASKASHCKFENGEHTANGSGVDGNITIKGKQYEGYEEKCTIRSAKQAGSKWTLSMDCDSEGELFKEKRVVNISGNTATFGERGKRVRCQ